VALVSVKLVELVLISVFYGPSHGWRCFELYGVHCQNLFSRMFKRCSAMDLRTPVMSTGFQANMSKLSFGRLQSSILPFSDKLSPIVTVCSGYSGWIATWIPSAVVGSRGGRAFYASATILHSAGIMVLLQIVTIPPSTGNFSIP
ncbi:hypothetical protein Tco_0670441, partial [Tanacetum coccineum]